MNQFHHLVTYSDPAVFLTCTLHVLAFGISVYVSCFFKLSFRDMFQKSIVAA